jgi:hypothetical protein
MTRTPERTRRLFTLVALLGDAALFVVFSALGRSEHSETRGFSEILYTASPFIAGWLLVAIARGAFRLDVSGKPARVARSTALTWLYAWPVGLALRALVQHRGIPVSFDLVALVVNACFLIGWRSAFQAVLRRVPIAHTS